MPMRLNALLAELPQEHAEQLAIEHIGPGETVSRAALTSTLEGVLRSYSFVRKGIGDRLPPTFAILETLLDAEGFTVPAAEFRALVEAKTRSIVDRVTSGDLVGRDASLQLYRRVFYEARRNDMVLDAGETAILSILRKELSIRTAEHYLIEHHPDFHHFWQTEESFLHEMQELRSCGMVFGLGGNIVLAEEVVPLVRQALGLELAERQRRRLFAKITSDNLSDVLGKVNLRISGTKEEKLDRLLTSYIQPSEALRGLQNQALRDLCQDLKANTGGSKDEMVERIVDHVLHDLDLATPQTDPAPPPAAEPRLLDPRRFSALFWSLKGDELTDILGGIGSSRLTGSKDTKVRIISDSHYSETTILETLTNKSLEVILGRARLKTNGSKRERVERLLAVFQAMPEAELVEPTAEPNDA
jgi:hypothetical protein